jgi:hypothetical protein
VTVPPQDGAEPGPVPPTPHEEGRQRAIDGLLYTEFGQGRGTAGERALARLRSEAASVQPAVEAAAADPGASTTVRLARRSASPHRLRSASRTGLRRQAYRRPTLRSLVRSWTAWTGAAAALLVAAVLGVLLQRGEAPGEQAAIIEALSGTVTLGSGDDVHLASRGDVLAPGMTLVTGSHSVARLHYRDGTVFDVTADARVTGVDPANPLGAQKMLRLDHGAVHADVAKQPSGRPLLVATADAQAVVVGTRLVVTAKTGNTRLNVEQGLVRLVRASDQNSVEVPAGKRVVAEETGAMIVQESALPALISVRPTLPIADGAGTGLQGEYFNDIEFKTPVFTRLDPTVDFDWGFESSPDPRIKREFYAVRWTGTLEPRFSESYLISTLSDDGVRVWIDGRLMMENWFEHPELWQVASLDLVAGRRYPIVVEFCEWRRYSLVHLYWQSLHQAREIIPRCQLFPP